MKKKNIRLLELNMDNKSEDYYKLATVKGGVLIQSHDDGGLDAAALIYPTTRQPTAQEEADLLFAWKAVKHVKSNAIVLAKDKQTVGIGAGQMRSEERRVGKEGRSGGGPEEKKKTEEVE